MAAVAFLGLGTMGAPMATRPVTAGHEVTGWNRTRTSVAGARIADTPAAAAGGADIVIMMLANPAAVEDVVFGTDGAVSAIQPGSVLVEMSTIGPHAVAGLAVLDAVPRRAAQQCQQRHQRDRQNMITFHNPTTAPPPAAAYSNVAEIDLGSARLLILAGQVALDYDGKLVGGDDMRAQTKQVFDIIGALLADRGASFADVVNIRTYLADMDRLAEYGEVRRTYLTDDALPTSTTVEVSRLFRPGALLEVDITAAVRGTE